MIHTIAYSSTPGSIAADQQVTPLTDSVFPTTWSNDFLLPRDLFLYGAYAGGTDLTSGRIQTPRLKSVSSPHIQRISATGAPGTNPNFDSYLMNPIPLKAQEPLRALATISVITQQVFVVLFVGDAIKPAPVGTVFTLRFTNASTRNAGVWTTVSPVFEDTIQGTFAVLSHACTSATIVASRLIFPGQVERPGALGVAAPTYRVPELFYGEYLGVVGQFSGYAPFLVDVLATGADSALTGYVQVIKIA